MKRYLSIFAVFLGILAFLVWRRCQNSSVGTNPQGISPDPATGRVSPLHKGRPSTREEHEVEIRNKCIEFAKANNAPIAFYGRVVDQDGKPLSGVAVSFTVTAIPKIPVPWGPDESMTGSCATDQNGVFSVRDKYGVGFGVDSLVKAGYRATGFYQQGHVRYEPYSMQKHIPDSSKPVEFMLIRDDLPRAEKVADKLLNFTWNAGPVRLDCGNMIGAMVLTPAREGMNPANKLQPFDWSIEILGKGFGMALLPDPDCRIAPTAGYQTQCRLGFPKESKKWRARESYSYAIKTSDGNYGIMKLDVAGDGEDGHMSGSVTIHLNKNGSRNLDHK